MRIYTKAGDMVFDLFNFPDGQPHFRLKSNPYGDGFRNAVIETKITNPTDLFILMLVSEVLKNLGFSLDLDIRYLMAARMDRAIDSTQPFTLQVVARIINSLGFGIVRILDVHSDVAIKLIRNSINVLPYDTFYQAVNTLGVRKFIVPDKGAMDRVRNLTAKFDEWPLIQCEKVRDPQTGELSQFKVWDEKYVKDQDVLIVDDICDGGATFVGLAKELHKVGAKKVYLFVTHGIFSKGFPLKGIGGIFTTDSYLADGSDINPGYSKLWDGLLPETIRFPIRMSDIKS